MKTESTNQMKKEILEFCIRHNFNYESSKDLLQAYLTALVEKAKMEQMADVSHLLKQIK